MRVALVVLDFDPRRGGAEQWAYQFAQRLVADGHEVHVVARQFGPDGDGLPIVRHQVRIGRAARWAVPWVFAAASEKTLREVRADIVHDLGYGWRADIFQPHWGTRRGAFRQNLELLPEPGRTIKRLVAPLLPRYRLLNRLEDRQFDARDGRLFLALSQMVRRDMQRYHGIPDAQLRVVYNGVDVERFSPEQCGQWRGPTRRRIGLGRDLLLLLIAHNFRLKGLRTIIEALGTRAQNRQPVRLLVVGKGRPGPYARLARRLGCADRVHFIGAADDPRPFYAAADVYVHPTFYDPCSLVVLEALACGLPVITSVHNGASEIMMSGREGFILQDPRDAVQLSEAVTLLQDPGRRASMQEAARATALQHSWERNYQEVLDLYHHVRTVNKQPVGN